MNFKDLAALVLARDDVQPPNLDQSDIPLVLHSDQLLSDCQ